LPGLTKQEESAEICILGPQELIEPFRAMGLAAAKADLSNALQMAKDVAKNNFKIVFYSEDFYPLLHEFLSKRAGGMFPTFIPIPSLKKGEPYAMQRLRELIKKAIGVDVYWEAK